MDIICNMIYTKLRRTCTKFLRRNALGSSARTLCFVISADLCAQLERIISVIKLDSLFISLVQIRMDRKTEQAYQESARQLNDDKKSLFDIYLCGQWRTRESGKEIDCKLTEIEDQRRKRKIFCEVRWYKVNEDYRVEEMRFVRLPLSKSHCTIAWRGWSGTKRTWWQSSANSQKRPQHELQFLTNVFVILGYHQLCTPPDGLPE